MDVFARAKGPPDGVAAVHPAAISRHETRIGQEIDAFVPGTQEIRIIGRRLLIPRAHL
jgi:hypothetical protein